MKKRVIVMLILTAMCLGAVSAASAEPKEIVTLSTPLVRVELLSETLVRVETAGENGAFEDRATLIVVGRDSFDGVQATVRESADAYTAVTDAYTVTLKKNTALADNAVEIRSADGELLWRYDSGLSKEGLETVPAVPSATVAYYAYPNGVAANNGLTALTAKQGWSGANGIAGMVKNGGTIVFSGRGYVGASYTLPVLTSAVKMTGVAPDGSDYRRAGVGLELNARTGSFSPKAGSVFTIQSDVVFDDIILLSTGAQASTIRVANGATVAFGEGVSAEASADGYPHLALMIEADSRVLYSGGTFSAIRGSGTLVVTEETAKELSDALLSEFQGYLVFADGESLCKGYCRHAEKSGACSRCGAEPSADLRYVPINGFYAELPSPSATPDVFALADSPRVIPAEDGMAYVGSTDSYSGWEKNDATDLYLFLPQGNAETLRADFVRLTGRTPISNIKTFGSWYSRYEDWTEKDYLSVIENYRANDFPLDVLVVDTKWRSGADGTGYEIDTACFPDMAGYLATAKQMGVLSIFNDHTHKTSLQMLAPSELKHHTANLQKILDMGLDGWWYDRNWSYGLASPYREITGSTLGKVLYNDILASYSEKSRVFLMANADWNRNGTIESAPSVIGHRYGIQWTGDITSEALQLREELTNLLYSSTVGGSPYISSDLGGFKRAKQQSEEMYTRWMQYGALSPIFRIHSTMSSSKEIDKLPYTYSEQTQDTVRNYMKLRYNLLPLFYTLAHENYESGMPLCRRLDFYYPQYTKAADDTQYLLGKDLLVAPIWSAYGEGDEVVPASWYSDELTATYYNTMTLSGKTVLTETVKSIDFEWLNDAPAAGVNADKFSVRYTGKITPTEDCYLGAVADDGVLIYVDGKLHVDGWASGWLVSHLNTGTVLKAGQTYDIRVDYYDNSGGAACRLVYAHVTDPGISARDVFIPDGEWIDVFSGETLTGPQTVRVYHDVRSTPVFVRAGAVIPAVEEVSPIARADYEELSLNVYAGGDGTYTLYEDDGKTLDYQSGKVRKTAIAHVGDTDGGTLSIAAAAGNFTTAYTAREWRVRIHSDMPVTSVRLDGQTLTVTKIEKDADAFPLAENGAAPSGDVYEVVFTADMAKVQTLTYTVGATAGDVNGDGRVSLADVLAILCGRVSVDINKDGKTNGEDALAVLQIIVK